MKDKDKEKEKDKEKRSGGGRKFPFHMAARSDPSSPAISATGSATAPTSPSAYGSGSGSGKFERSETPFIPAPLEMRKSLSGSQRKRLFKTATPPHTPTTLSADTAENLFKRRAERTPSGISLQQRHSASSVEEGITVTVSPLASGASAVISPSGVTSTSPGGGRLPSFSPHHSMMSSLHQHHQQHPPVSPKTSSNNPGGSSTAMTASAAVVSAPPKSRFKMAHESFRIRMFQEQYGFEPVFMTKKRAADSKSSEFKGGDLNKYTSRSYMIKDGNEIFGGWF